MSFVQKHFGSVRVMILDLLAFAAGGIIYGSGVVAFIQPNEISPGGVTGISTIIHHVWGFPTGTMVLILNIPLQAMGWRKFGLGFIAKTAIATLASGFSLDLMELLLPAYTGNRLMAALFGGVLMGAGLALVFLRGSTTGGTDILAKLLRLRFPYLSMGRMILFIDTVIILTAALVYRDIESALYSVIALFCSSRTVDSLLYGADRGKLVFIVTKHPETMANNIFAEMRRGVTVLDATGGYTKSHKAMLMCAVRRQEASRLHAVVKKSDPEAFLVVTEAGEILGEGFKRIDEEPK